MPPSAIGSSAQQYTRTSTSELTLTTSGTVIVVTSVVTAIVSGVDPSASSGANGRNLNGSSSSSKAFFNNTGAVAGTFVVVGLVAAGIVIGLGFFFLRRKRRRRLDEDIRVAAGGAGDGGAGVNRFADDDDEEDSFEHLGAGSDGHLSSNYMSSYGNVPLTAAAAAAGFATHPSSGYDLGASGAGGAASGSPVTPSYDPGHSPAQSQGSSGAAAYNYAAVPTAAAYGAYGLGSGGARSQEGVQHDNWAEYVDTGAGTGYGRGARSAEGSPGNSASHEGFIPAGSSEESHYPGADDMQQVAPFRNSIYGNAAFDASNGGASVTGSAYGGMQTDVQPAAPAATPRGMDDRLDPGAIRAVENHSAASLADEHDYSRRILRIANPSD
ncbi:hypothetical protein JCM3770_000468 [Rhodotorula araucariae]